MTDVTVAGENLVSTTRASDLSGYSKDYIGQLCRGEKISCRRISGQWYIDLKSLENYRKREAKSGSPEDSDAPPYKKLSVSDSVNSMKVGNVRDDMFTYDGIEYVSTNRGADLTGYAQDYVGQLARDNEVAAKKVGRRWFISQRALLQHKKHNDAQLASVQSQAVGLRSTSKDDEKSAGEANEAGYHVTVKQGEEARRRANLNFNIRYITESHESLPIVRKSDASGGETVANIDPTVEDARDEQPDSNENTHTFDVLNVPIINRSQAQNGPDGRSLKDDIAVPRRRIRTQTTAHVSERKSRILPMLFLLIAAVLVAGVAWIGYRAVFSDLPPSYPSFLDLEAFSGLQEFLREKYGELIPGKVFEYSRFEN